MKFSALKGGDDKMVKDEFFEGLLEWLQLGGTASEDPVCIYAF